MPQLIVILICLHLIYKGIEITQIAYVSTAGHKQRIGGIVLGVLCIAGAVVVGFFSFNIIASMPNRMP